MVTSSCSTSLRKYAPHYVNNNRVCLLWTGRVLERSIPRSILYSKNQRREYGMLVVKALRGVLKIRYLLLGGAVAGGSALNQVFTYS